MNQACLHWIVSGTSKRWIPIVKCFAPASCPAPFALDLTFPEPAQVKRQLLPAEPTVILWVFESNEFDDCLRLVISAKRTSPLALQFVAIQDLSLVNQLALMELGITSYLSQPHELPMWSNCVQRNCNRFVQ